MTIICSIAKLFTNFMEPLVRGTTRLPGVARPTERAKSTVPSIPFRHHFPGIQTGNVEPVIK